MIDKKLGYFILLVSLSFLSLALFKVSGQPLNNILYTSRATVGMFLFISLVLGTTALTIIFRQRNKQHQHSKKNHN